MVAQGLFRFMGRGGALRRYRNHVRAILRQAPLVQALPALLTLPLLDGAPARLPASGGSLALSGPPGSGRGLALLQMAWAWAAGERSEPLLLCSLAQADALNLTPRAILAHLLHTTDLPSPLTRPDTSTRRWWLLFDHWDMLPDSRREAWRSFLLTMPMAWPEAQVVVSLPDDEPPWPGFAPLELPGPDEAIRRAWLGHLLPQHNLQPLLAALQPGAPLEPLRDQAADLALLALVYPGQGLPTSRAALYEQGEVLLGVASQEAHESPAAYADERRFAAYRLARACVERNDLTRLALLDAAEQIETAPLAAALMADPAPLYELLWDMGRPSRAGLLALAACLRERPASAPERGLDVLAALIERQDDRAARRALRAIVPVLPTVLVAADAGGAGAQAAALLGALGPLLGAQALAGLLDDQRVAESLRWAAADALLQFPAAEATGVPGENPPDALARAARAYLFAHGSPSDQQRLSIEPLRSWLDALTEQAAPRRAAVAQKLIAGTALPPDLRMLALTWSDAEGHLDDPGPVIAACSDPHPGVRRAALEVLRRCAPEQLTTTLAKLLFNPAVTAAVRADLLEAAALLPQAGAIRLFARVALDEHMPLALRLRALVLAARLPGVTVALLRRLALHEPLHPLVRAGAVGLIGKTLAGNEPPPDLLVDDLARLGITGDLAGESPMTFLIRLEAIKSLGRLTSAERAAARLVMLLARGGCDNRMELAALEALEAHASPATLDVLCRLVSGDLDTRRRAFWLARAPQISGVPAIHWPLATLPSGLGIALLTALSEGETTADPPSGFEELIATEQTRLRLAAAKALAMAARRAPAERRRVARITLAATARRTTATVEIKQLLEYMALAGGDSALHGLGQILGDPTAAPVLRWLAIEQIESSPARGVPAHLALALLLRFVEHEQSDSFARAIAAMALGRSGSPLALPILHGLAERRDGDPHLRSRAITALGLLAGHNDPELARQVEQLLLRILLDRQVPAGLRGAAARALPLDSRATTRAALGDLLRRERQAPEIVSGVLEMLGRAGDREGLDLMRRYSQSEYAEEAIAAINAIVALGDASLAPNLVRLTLRVESSPPVRLAAAVALLQLGGPDYLALIRGYIGDGPPPLRLQALDHVARLLPDHPLPAELARSRSTPLIVRLRALELIAPRTEHHALLANLVVDHTEEIRLRRRVAALIGAYANDALSLDALARCASAPESDLLLRRACFNALAAQAREERPCALEARLALSSLAEGQDQPLESRYWAAAALLDAII